MLKHICHYIFTLCILNLNSYFCYASSDIQQAIISIPSLKKLFNTAPSQKMTIFEQYLTQNSLLIIDLDGTLIHEQPAFKNSRLRHLIFQLSQETIWFITLKKLQVLWTFYKKRCVRLVEPEWKKILHIAHTKGATIVALTKHSLAIIPANLAIRHRYKEIKTLELTSYFTSTFNNKNSFTLHFFNSYQEAPIFYKDILMTTYHHKGDTLIN